MIQLLHEMYASNVSVSACISRITCLTCLAIGIAAAAILGGGGRVHQMRKSCNFVVAVECSSYYTILELESDDGWRDDVYTVLSPPNPSGSRVRYTSSVLLFFPNRVSADADASRHCRRAYVSIVLFDQLRQTRRIVGVQPAGVDTDYFALTVLCAAVA